MAKDKTNLKINELYFVLFELIHNDNEVSAFYVIEEALKILCRCRNQGYKNLYKSLQIIMAHIEKLEKFAFGNYDVNRLYPYRTINDYLHDRSVYFKDVPEITEECLWISLEMDRVGEIVWGIESADNANGNLINAWLDTVPSEAYHPFAVQQDIFV